MNRNVRKRGREWERGPFCVGVEYEGQCHTRAGSMPGGERLLLAPGPHLTPSSSSAPAQYQAMREVRADEPG